MLKWIVSDNSNYFNFYKCNDSNNCFWNLGTMYKLEILYTLFIIIVIILSSQIYFKTQINMFKLDYTIMSLQIRALIINVLVFSKINK